MTEEVTQLRATRTQRPRDPFSMFFAWGLERLTKSLLDGDEYDRAGFAQLEIMSRRCQAFVNAFNERRAVEEQRAGNE